MGYDIPVMTEACKLWCHDDVMGPLTSWKWYKQYAEYYQNENTPNCCMFQMLITVSCNL